MKVVLWDSHSRHVTKDFGGGFGMGAYHGLGGFRGRWLRRRYLRDRRPVALAYACLAAIFARLGHSVEYVVDAVPAGADAYLFHPALATLDLELQAMAAIRAAEPRATLVVTGPVAYAMPEQFAVVGATVVRGEPEQLLWRWDEVVAHGPGLVDVGMIADLDALPFPDWSPFRPRGFRIGYDFTRFPTALIQRSRGCVFTCNYCPYILMENRTRFRSAEAVVEEIRYGMKTWGFRSFKFRDPLFGLNWRDVTGLIEGIARLPQKIQFSIETRIDLMRRTRLRALRDVGLTSVTVGVETPSETTLRNYKRKPIADDRQHQFLETCRQLGVRTAAGFMIGFPSDTRESILSVLRYAKRLNPTYANFNIVTPYPGTPFYDESSAARTSAPWRRYDMYTPVLAYEHLTADEVHQLHAKCFTSYYTRWPYLFANAHLLWPKLQWLGVGRSYRRAAVAWYDEQEPSCTPATEQTLRHVA